MHPKAREYYMERDARNAASDNVTISQAKADQAKAVREEHTVETPWTDSQDQKAQVITVTHNQKKEGLKMWKDLLILTKDYRPFQHRSEEENLKEVNILWTAMSDFRNLKLLGMDTLHETHPAFAGLQAKYNILRELRSSS